MKIIEVFKRKIVSIQPKSFFIGMGIALVLGSFYSSISGRGLEEQEISGEVVTVEHGDISRTIKALGKVTMANEQQLRFNQLGKVSNVYAAAGDSVKRDDLLAELDKTKPLADVRQAELSVSEAWLRLRDLEAGSTDQIITAQNSLRDTERQLEEAYGSLPTEEKKVEFALEQARRAVKEKEAALLQSQLDMITNAENAVADAEDIMDDIYAVITGGDVIRVSTRNKEFIIDFLYANFTLKNETEFAYYDATNALNDFKDKYPSITNMTDTRALSTVLYDLTKVIEEIKEFAEVTYDFLGTAVPSINYSDSDINTLKSTMYSIRTSALSLLDSVRGQRSTLTGLGTNTAQQNLDKAKDDLTTLELQFKNGITSADDMERSIENLNDSLRSRGSNLKKTEISLDVQIRQQQNTLAQRNVALEKSKMTLEDFELRAPFDGIIRRIDFQVGDNLLADANETKYIIMENPEYLIVTLQLDQVDIIHIKEGQRASITFDAMPDKTLDGVVDFINTTPVEQSGVVSYEVDVALDKTDETILSGMTASVEIETDSKLDVLVVPNLALQRQGERAFVTTEDGSSVQIETGITDGRFTEVISGIAEGAGIQSINLSIPSVGQTETERRSPNSAQMMMRMGGSSQQRPR
ncbi:HlyD family efflux transporter periplasmic adaptor subunit [Patescibacteria group bacterium]|nr:HlyD family efflux transporter periplasmic adaptor subunit [Patescibacteria group bacterium]